MGVKYLTCLNVRTLWVAPIYESTIHRIFVTYVVLMEAIFPYFNLKPHDCNLATTILGHKLFQLHKTLILGRLWLVFLQLEWGSCSEKCILAPYLTLISGRNIRCD